MYQDDYYNFEEQNDFESEHDVEKMLEREKMKDKGYNVIYRKVLRHDGRTYNKKFKVYTSSGTGTRIRDVETGQYSSSIVGSKDEDLFYKVSLSTSECRSTNGYNTLFFMSPQHCANYLQCEVDPEVIRNWEVKRDARLAELSKMNKSKCKVVRNS
jgi:hypothetical protein